LFGCIVWDAASIHILYISLVKLSINKMNESAGGEEDVAVPLLSKTLEDILYNIITQKKVETHKTQNRADTTDRVWREISKHCNEYYQNFSIRRQLRGHGERYYY
jgi:hypothetical protein